MSDSFQRVGRRFGTAFEAIEPHLRVALDSAADPERSLIYLERLLESGGESLLSALVKNPRLIESLVTIFSGSQFLTEILLRDPKSLSLLIHRKSLTERKSAEQIHTEGLQHIHETPEKEKLDSLRRYQRGELLRVG